VVPDAVDYRLTGPRTHVERRRNPLRHERCIEHGRQVNKHSAVGVLGFELMCKCQGDARLANSAGASQGQESRADNQLRDLGKLALPSDEWRRLNLERVALGPSSPLRPASGHECRPLRRRQPQRIGQARCGVRIRKAAGAAFQIGYAAAADTCALRERLL
jgi:hypothetical protein